MKQKIKVTTNFPGEPILRQTPSHSGTWKDCQFVVDDAYESTCDSWVVLSGMLKPEKVFCRSGRAIFFAMEPPGIPYGRSFLEQFDLVITCDTSLEHHNLGVTFQGLPWHAGLDKGLYGAGEAGFRSLIDYDSFVKMQVPQKTRNLSVLCSTTTLRPGHRLRLKFVAILKRELGGEVEVFGRGFRAIGDKFAAIAPFKYHIALESSVVPHYWSEKLGDAFLCLSYPFYWGCPNINDYFDHRGLTPIDIARPDQAIDTIKRVISENTYEQALEHLKMAKQLMCEQYNTFEVIRQACQSLAPREPRMIQLNPYTASYTASPSSLKN